MCTSIESYFLRDKMREGYYSAAYYFAHRTLTVNNRVIKVIEGYKKIKRGIGALYELCAPSTTPHS